MSMLHSKRFIVRWAQRIIEAIASDLSAYTHMHTHKREMRERHWTGTFQDQSKSRFLTRLFCCLLVAACLLNTSSQGIRQCNTFILFIYIYIYIALFIYILITNMLFTYACTFISRHNSQSRNDNK